MGDTIWLAFQALGTMLIVIVVAFLSWKQTQKMLADRRPKKPSALARATPDPQFHPDPEVTDPFHVTDAHHEPSTGDRSGSGLNAGRQSEAGLNREHDREEKDAYAASREHPSGVERLDGIVKPAAEVRHGAGSDAAARPGEAR